MSAVVYYRDLDGIVIGSTNSPGKVDISFELKSWGPGVSALEVLDDTVLVGKIRKVVNNKLTYVIDTDYETLKNRKRSLWDKTKARLLFTDQEMELFLGKRP